MNIEMDTGFVCLYNVRLNMHVAHASIDGGGRTDQTESDAFACDNGDIWHNILNDNYMEKRAK